MNHKALKIIMAVAVLAGLIFLGRSFFTQRAERVQALPPAIKLASFQGKNPPYNFTFEYPEAWRVGERGYKEDYDMVEVLCVSNKDALIMPGIFITKRDLREGDTEKGLMNAWLRDEGRYGNFKMASLKTINVVGQKGLKAEYSYALSLPPWTGSAQSVLVKKNQIVFIRKSASFQITFMGTEEQFKTYRPVFDHVLETFRFLD